MTTMRERMARAIADAPCNGASVRTVIEAMALAIGKPWNEETFGQDMLTLADAVLDAMRGDPGHDVTEAVVEPMADRTEALRIWSGMIDAIREGK